MHECERWLQLLHKVLLDGVRREWKWKASSGKTTIATIVCCFRCRGWCWCCCGWFRMRWRRACHGGGGDGVKNGSQTTLFAPLCGFAKILSKDQRAQNHTRQPPSTTVSTIIMKSFITTVALLSLLLAPCAVLANDPAGSWLAYTSMVHRARVNERRLTHAHQLARHSRFKHEGRQNPFHECNHYHPLQPSPRWRLACFLAVSCV